MTLKDFAIKVVLPIVVIGILYCVYAGCCGNCTVSETPGAVIDSTENVVDTSPVDYSVTDTATAVDTSEAVETEDTTEN